MWLIFGLITAILIYIVVSIQVTRKKISLKKSLISYFSIAGGIIVFILGMVMPIFIDQLTQLIDDAKSMGK
ncbi:MAG: hypothetical protein Q4G17_00315 [Staphylococcus xylosus]|nr:hypothetical protein [Staphylococcus xylosus]